MQGSWGSPHFLSVWGDNCRFLREGRWVAVPRRHWAPRRQRFLPRGWKPRCWGRRRGEEGKTSPRHLGCRGGSGSPVAARPRGTWAGGGGEGALPTPGRRRQGGPVGRSAQPRAVQDLTAARRGAALRRARSPAGEGPARAGPCSPCSRRTGVASEVLSLPSTACRSGHSRGGRAGQAGTEPSSPSTEPASRCRGATARLSYPPANSRGGAGGTRFPSHRLACRKGEAPQRPEPRRGFSGSGN